MLDLRDALEIAYGSSQTSSNALRDRAVSTKLIVYHEYSSHTHLTFKIVVIFIVIAIIIINDHSHLIISNYIYFYPSRYRLVI